MTTGTAGATGGPSTPSAALPRSRSRGAWAGDRWWAPGAVAAAVTAVVSCLLTLAWRAWEAGGCGQGQAFLACLLPSLVGTGLALTLGPLLLWWAYRVAGVRRAWLSVVVAAVLAGVLLAGPELLSQVLLLTGAHRPLDPLLGPGVGVLLGLAVLGGGLALQGPARVVRAVVAAAALAALVVASVVLAGPADRAREREVLLRAQVPLLLPAGWQPYGPYVGEGGDLSYEAVPEGWRGDPWDGVDVELRRGAEALDRADESCGYRACAASGDIGYELPEEGSGVSAWRVVAGTVLTVSVGPSDGPSTTSRVPSVDPVEVLRAVETVGPDEWLDRTYDAR